MDIITQQQNLQAGTWHDTAIPAVLEANGAVFQCSISLFGDVIFHTLLLKYWLYIQPFPLWQNVVINDSFVSRCY